MTARKRRGIGFFISGAAFVGLGAILVSTTATPEWVVTVLNVVGIVANALGFTTVFPDIE